MSIKIPFSEPDLGLKEKEYLNQAIDSGWIGGRGDFIDKFEDSFSKFIGVKHAITCSNGTAALQLALLSSGIRPENEIHIPRNTFIATKNMAILATSKVIEHDEDETWNMPMKQFRGSKPSYILGVSLYGNPLNTDYIDKNRHFIIEDTAQALGSKFHGRRVGSFGQISTFSLHSAKMITSGEGGVLCTDNDAIAKSIRLLKNQSMLRPYVHQGIGFNFRLTNLQAAVGLAQLERIEELIEKKMKITKFYNKHLSDKFTRQKETRNSVVVKWTNAYKVENAIKLRFDLDELAIETRPGFVEDSKVVAFPSGTKLTESELSYICEMANNATR